MPGNFKPFPLVQRGREHRRIAFVLEAVPGRPELPFLFGSGAATQRWCGGQEQAAKISTCPFGMGLRHATALQVTGCKLRLVDPTASRSCAAQGLPRRRR